MYNPEDWYWFIAGDRTKVFSSKERKFVALDDENYQAFLARGCSTSTTNSAEDLCEVLNAEIDKEIDAIEISQLRSMRELILDPSSIYAKNKVKTIDDQIKVLRAQRLNLTNLEN